MLQNNYVKLKNIKTKMKAILKTTIALVVLLLNNPNASAQQKYSNPIISADYSDPDVIRVEDDYYMTSSSFNMVPGLPVLHSKDLINWTIIGHGVQKLPDAQYSYARRSDSELDYNVPRPGKGVFAPCIRYHDGFFWIFWADPDAGAYMVKAKNPEGPWSKPHLIKKAHGWIDTSPLWDEETGRAWLSYAYARSRSGINSRIAVAEMNWEGTELLSYDKVIFDANDMETYPADRKHFVIEGTKFMKRNGYYYILCPAGGVPTGWQTVLRSINPNGPYEIKVVCETGNTNINGPHQGGLFNTPNGEWWFAHFQSVNVLGRIVWLQPAKWVNDWPVIGVDNDGDGTGYPIMEYSKPNTGYTGKQFKIQMSDEFNEKEIGLQWQWPANSGRAYCSQQNGNLIIKSFKTPNLALDNAPNVITQMFPDFKFTAISKVKLISDDGIVRGGMSVMGQNCFDIGVESNNGNLELSVRKDTTVDTSIKIKDNELFLKLEAEGEHPLPLMDEGERNRGYVYCQFSYSYDGNLFHPLGSRFQAKAGTWIGARVGLYCLSNSSKQSHLMIDSFFLKPE
jgi:beta-xylosidase